MEPADASTLGREPDASTLTATAFNVGMIGEDSFETQQKVKQLARWVIEWLEGTGGAVVGLNEIHPTIARKLWRQLHMKAHL